MADEEAGFTFVDKRRTQAETPATDDPPAQAEAREEYVGAEAEEPGGAENFGSAPTTYDLLGYCLNLLASQAWQKLGLLADPQTGEANPDLTEAKVAIDAVSDLARHLESAPETLVPAEMRREMRTLLNDLRLNYVAKRGQDGHPIA